MSDVIQLSRDQITQVWVRIEVATQKERADWVDRLVASKLGTVEIPELGSFTVLSAQAWGHAVLTVLAPTSDAAGEFTNEEPPP